MTRRRWLGLGAVVLVLALGGAVFFALVRDDGPDHVPGERSLPERAEVSARVACRAMAEVEDLVRANASADDVFDAVDRASEAGKRAAEDDLKWLPLSSGIEAVKVGLEKNDGPAANIGIRTTRGHCTTLTG